MHRYVATISCAVALLWGGAETRAQPATDTKVVLAPLGTLGAEAKSKATTQVQQTIIAGLRAVPGTAVVAGKQVLRAIKKAKRPELRICDGKPSCLAELGKLLGARYVVYGEIGGLGKVRVVYLKIVDVNRARELRSTTLEIGGSADLGKEARASAFRLLAPKAYKGRLVVSVDIAKASIYVDGKHLAKSPAKALQLTVGTHALRVTHPEYRDFVRFVDVQFDSDAKVDVKLTRFPIVRSKIRERPGQPTPTPGGTQIVYRGVEATPWYKRWYTVAGAGAAIFIGSAIVVGIIADGIAHDREKTVGK